MIGLNGQGNEDGKPESLRDMLRSHILEQRDFNKKVERLHNVVLGDEEAKQDGLVHKVDRHSKYISVDKKMKWIGAGLAVSGGTGWAFLDNIKQFLLK